MRLLIINGPNLNMLGIREAEVYGNISYEELSKFIYEFANLNGVEVKIFHSNIEGEIINEIHNSFGKFDGIIINPGAYTHYSYAIHDAIKSVNIPTIEVHLSNIYSREEYRRKSVIAPSCVGQITGLGKYSYILAIAYFTKGE
ncbi:3-dehydroquinate dehydratase [Caloramator mitchellensis]|uniref:3-dehydroquinate dehydratase n=1 Tax=Caloramator mitchellensis TaxID=908809 RepID=A0A0R3K3E8_CALMK|nr:type II 3-dehydroquinate dehydratase [Caloramator mitchellensis]KRQ86847.1 3-dehydroquinate dehydratase [Caloramator mitchellensis]